MECNTWAGFWNIGSFSKIFTYTIKKIVAALKVLVPVAGETFNHAETSLYECLGYIYEAFVRQAPNSGWVRADWKSRDRISMEIHWIAVISLYIAIFFNAHTDFSKIAPQTWQTLMIWSLKNVFVTIWMIFALNRYHHRVRREILHRIWYSIFNFHWLPRSTIF